MTLQKTKTLTRAGKFDNQLEEAVKGFTEPLTKVQVGLGNTVKYAMFKQDAEPYLLMVSQQIDRLVNSFGYNTILTLTSYSDERNKQVAEQFEKETGINLNVKIPEQLKRHFPLMGMTFQAFEKNPKAAMEFLRGAV